MEELNNDPETHSIIADIRLENIQERVSETNKLTHQLIGGFDSLKELMKNEFDFLKAQKNYPIKIRKVEYWDEEQNRKFVFLTNVKEQSGLDGPSLFDVSNF